MTAPSQRAIFDNDVIATGVAILFCGVFVGGYILGLLLEYLGFKNDWGFVLAIVVMGLFIYGWIVTKKIEQLRTRTQEQP